MEDLYVNSRINVPGEEMQVSFVRSSGPGGQKANRSASAVQLRFDVKNSRALPEDVRRRFMRLAGSRISKEGELVIEASVSRSQQKNREEARRRLGEWLRQAATKKKKRKPTRPSRKQREKRLRRKKEHGEKKQRRKDIL